MEVICIYICPKCGNYYGASGMGKLEDQANRDLKNDITHYRDRCPDCGETRTRRFARLIPEDEVSRAFHTVHIVNDK
jgi:predicted RNA-binding Zn-ribbon protein involved in translation (DUF1610 family)